MGLRYRKSVKICKGVRVNFSKSGVSYSFGGKGASLNVGKRGARATVGIPGTGLSYSKSVSNAHRSSNRPSSYSTKSQETIVSTEIKLYLDDDGKMTYRYADGREITDPSFIRKIRATPQFKAELARMEAERRCELTRNLEETHKSAEEFLNLHWLAPKVSSQEDFVNLLNSLTPQKYVRREFSRPKPTSEQIMQGLAIEAKTAVKTKMFWKKKSLQREYIEAHLPERLAHYQQRWETDRLEFESNELEHEKQQNEVFLREYEASKQNILSKINGEEDFINQTIEEWIEECSLPVEININYSYSQSENLLCIDLDLPEIEDIPDSELVQLASGNLKEKKKTQQKLRQEYATLIFGLSIFVAANLMNLSPAIRKVILSGYTQRRDSSGNLNDDYILSVKFIRDVFEQSSFGEINPIDFCMQFENRCKITSTMLFKAIEPYSN